MWPFKKKAETVIKKDMPREYFDVSIKLDDGEFVEFRAWDISTHNPYHNFQTTDGWREFKVDAVRYIRIKYLNEQNVVSIQKPTNA